MYQSLLKHLSRLNYLKLDGKIQRKSYLNGTGVETLLTPHRDTEIQSPYAQLK